MEYKGKSLKAVRALIAIEKDVEEIKKKLKVAREYIFDKIVDVSDISIVDKKEKLLVSTKKGDDKKRFSVLETPERIEFTLNSIRFYIDFLVIAHNENGMNDIAGAIIYGTQRSLCLESCLKNSNVVKRMKEHQAVITRCDGLEDKPMLELTINHQGRIVAKQGLDDEWWIGEKLDSEIKKGLAELHYQTMAVIWHDALNWANEKLLP